MGLLDRLFGRSKAKTSPTGTIDPAFAQQVVNDFGAALGANSARAGGVSDASELPHSKETIKAALLFALSFPQDERARDQLKAGYLSLADWQDGVGTSAHGLDFSKLDLEGDPVELAKNIQAQGLPPQELLDRVEAESQQLLSDLKNRGL